MAYVHIAAARGMTIDNFRQVAEKFDPPANIDRRMIRNTKIQNAAPKSM